MITDRVGDFIIRLQNASAIHADSVSVPHSAHLEAIAKKLKELGFVGDVSVAGDVKKTLTVALVYAPNGTPKIRGVKRLSKPGRRLYVSHTEAHTVAGGTGARLISTPSGVVGDKEARTNRAGGETLFEIW